MRISINNNTLTLMVGDITEQTTDFIVNAANGSLLGGGGVDGAIHRVAGPMLLETNQHIRSNLLANAHLPSGEAVLTKGFNLPAAYVIHTVGPVWENRGIENDQLVNCYKNSLLLAYMMNDALQEMLNKNHGILSRDITWQQTTAKKQTSISFPSISTGIYRFPIEQAAEIALTTIYEFLTEENFGDVVMTLFSETDFAIYSKVLRKIVEAS